MTFDLTRAVPRTVAPRPGQRVIIRIMGVAGAPPSVHDGRWLIAWNPHVDDTIGDVVTTDIRGLATVFDIGTVNATRCAVSKRRPLLPDGSANRPLTAYSCLFIGV